MATRSDIESFLVRMGLPFEGAGDGMWVVREEAQGGAVMVVSHQPPVTIFRVKLMDKPARNPLPLFEKLLELNASEMVSGAYGLEDGSIVCVETLQSENLDYNEFQAAVESLFVAMTEHYPVLREFRDAAA